MADSGYLDLIKKTNAPYVSSTVDPAGREAPSAFPKTTDDLVGTAPLVWWKQKHPNVTKAALLYADVGGVAANVQGTAKAIEKAGFQLVEPPIAVGVADPDYTGQVRNMRQQRYEPEIKGSLIAFNDRFSKLLKTEGDGWENNLAYLPFLDPAEKGKSPAVNDFLTWNQRVFRGSQMDLFNIAGWWRAAYARGHHGLGEVLKYK